MLNLEIKLQVKDKRIMIKVGKLGKDVWFINIEHVSKMFNLVKKCFLKLYYASKVEIV